jgi:hypothetical protein
MAMASMRRGGVRAAQNSMTTTRRAFLATDAAPLKRTALHADHVALGGRMVPFCGWDMPVQYKESIIDTHTHTRTHAGLFDVSHMGQLKYAHLGNFNLDFFLFRSFRFACLYAL